MSDLVEKVAEIIRGGLRDNGTSKDKARAAILAVLEHYSDIGNVSDVMLNTAADQLPCGDLITDVDVYDAITEALRAELERLRGEK